MEEEAIKAPVIDIRITWVFNHKNFKVAREEPISFENFSKDTITVLM